MRLDDKFLFTVTQMLENTGTAPFSAAPYGILARHGKPDTQNFFVLHEGVVGMTDGKLLEEKIQGSARLDAAVAGEGPMQLIEVQENGWIGFTDKYWMTTLAPARGQSFHRGGEIRARRGHLPDRRPDAGCRLHSPRRDRSTASYLFAGCQGLGNHQWLSGKIPGIDRFCRLIDWGWFYFLTKPIFRILHWLHGLIGKYGLVDHRADLRAEAAGLPAGAQSLCLDGRMKNSSPRWRRSGKRTGDDRMKYQKR